MSLSTPETEQIDVLPKTKYPPHLEEHEEVRHKQPDYDWRTLDLEDVITEDDEPVDNQLSDFQQYLLRDSARSPKGRFMVARVNVGIFSEKLPQPLVPDLFLTVDIQAPNELEERPGKKNRSYFVERQGKPPDVVVEIVSNNIGGEDSKKITDYATIGVPYYVIYDPYQHLSTQKLRCFELRDGAYVQLADNWLPKMELGLTFWKGTFAESTGTWLRWCDREGQILLTGKEEAEQERQRADQAEAWAEQERQRTQETVRRMAAKGFDSATIAELTGLSLAEVAQILTTG